MLGSRKDASGHNVWDDDVANADIAAVTALHQDQIAKYGKDKVGDMPNLLHKPVVLALVCEHAGKIIDAYYFEAVLELCGVGCSPRAAVALKHASNGLFEHFKKRGFRMMRTFIPREVAEPVGEQLELTGFKPQDEFYAHFLKDLR